MKNQLDAIDRVAAWIDEGRLLKSEGVTSISLSRALARLSGAKLEYEETRDETEIANQIGEHDQILYVLIDGLGLNQRKHFLPGGFFDRSCVRDIRSVFPSTTAAALTSLYSGAWPGIHGVTGWFTYLPEFQQTVIPLVGVERFSKRSMRHYGISFDDITHVPSMLSQINRVGRGYTFRKYRSGAFANWSRGGTEIEGYRSLENGIKRLLRHYESPKRLEPAFINFYYSEIDNLSHQYGWDSPEVIREIKRVDRQLKRARAVLPDSVRIVVSADHGHVNVPDEEHKLLIRGDELIDYLLCPHSGEARAPLFHVIPGSESDFYRAFMDRFGDSFQLITPDVAESLRLYGPDPLSSRTRSHLGTFIGIARDASAIEYVDEVEGGGVGHIGMHGGMSRDEVAVPLFLA